MQRQPIAYGVVVGLQSGQLMTIQFADMDRARGFVKQVREKAQALLKQAVTVAGLRQEILVEFMHDGNDGWSFRLDQLASLLVVPLYEDPHDALARAAVRRMNEGESWRGDSE